MHLVVRVFFLFLSICLIASPSLAQRSTAEDPTIVMKPQLRLVIARKMVAAAIADAEKRKGACSVAVVDDTGVPLALERMENVMVASALLAPEKARSATFFKKPSADLEKTINDGRNAMVTAEGFNFMQGALPIIIGGKVAGAIGTSCDVKDHDIPVSQAGLSVLSKQ